MPGVRPLTGIAHTVPLPPAMTVVAPPSGRIASEHAAETSVFHTIVTAVVVSSCRYGPRLRVTAPAGRTARAASAAQPSTRIQNGLGPLICFAICVDAC